MLFKKVLFTLFLLVCCLSSCNKSNTAEINHKKEKISHKLNGKVIISGNQVKPKVFTNITISDLKGIEVSKNYLNPNVKSVIYKTETIAQDEIWKKIPTFLSIKTTVKDASFIVSEMKIPKKVNVSAPKSKEANPQNFSSFSIYEGVSHSYIQNVVQGPKGNLWIATYGGGFCKFNGKTFTQYTIKEGLNSDYIYTLNIDKAGNIWYYEDRNGISKYDGKFIYHYSESTGLIHDRVNKIIEDNKNNIWVATREGISYLENKKFHNISISENKSPVPLNVLTIFNDAENNKWLSIKNLGIAKYDGKKFQLLNTSNTDFFKDVRAIMQDKSGKIWFACYGAGIAILDNNKIQYYSQEQGLIANNVNDVYEDSNSNIWISTSSGLSKIKDKCIKNFGLSDGLSSIDCKSVFEDKSGNIWISTYAGLNLFNGSLFNHYTEKEGFSGNIISSILKDSKGKLWFCTNNGISTLYNNEITNYKMPYFYKDGAATKIIETKNSEIVFVGQDCIIKYDGKTFKSYFSPAFGQISSIIEDKFGNFWVGSYGQGLKYFNGKEILLYDKNTGMESDIIYGFIHDKKGAIWLGSYYGLYKIEYQSKDYTDITITRFTKSEGLPNNVIFAILADNKGKIWLGTNGSGLLCMENNNYIKIEENCGLSNNSVYSLFQDKNENIWVGTRNGINKLNSQIVNSLNCEKSEINFDSEIISYNYDDGFLGVNCWRNALSEDSVGNIWCGTGDRLTCLFNNNLNNDTIVPSVEITEVELFNQSIPWAKIEKNKDTTLKLGNGLKIGNLQFDSIAKWNQIPVNLSLRYDNNFLNFNFIGISTKRADKIKYQYKLEGIDKQWSISSKNNYVAYGNLPAGDYIFKVKCENNAGNWSKESMYSFSIRPPWFKTILAYFIYVVLSIVLIALIIKQRTRSLILRQKELEKIVTERTFEVVLQKEIAEQQKNLVELKNHEILDSLHYAQRLQEAILPPIKMLNKYLKEYFVFYKPKDIVAGDFYWLEKIDEDLVLIAAADCTGHGVPGAMISVVCSNALNRAVKEFQLSTPNLILNKVRELVLETFEKSEKEVADGMDISLCLLNIKTRVVTWAGANSPIWIKRKDAKIIEEIKGDKQSIALNIVVNDFTNHTIQLNEGDNFYIFSDGYVDQFGGERGGKFLRKRFKELLLHNAHLSMQIQCAELENTLNKWQGILEQVDDICVIGVSV